jgi:uncharacterized metal-binding protein YceD (DUF177 family)
MSTPWIVTHDGTHKPPYTMECERCGATYTLPLPVSVNIFVAATKGFIEDHRGCKP